MSMVTKYLRAIFAKTWAWLARFCDEAVVKVVFGRIRNESTLSMVTKGDFCKNVGVACKIL